MSVSNDLIILREVSIKADSQDFRSGAKSLGTQAAEIFTGKAQIKKLENIAHSSLKITDIFNYIKRQTGKENKWNDKQFGSQLLEKLEALEQEEGNCICAILKIDNPREKMKVNLLLAREFIRQLVVHYEYETRDKR